MFYDLKCIYCELNQTSVWKLSTAGMKGSFTKFSVFIHYRYLL